MPLDPSIILGAKPPQFDMAQFSPINTLTSVANFQQANEASQLNALRMREYERQRIEEEGTQNYLADPTNDLTTPAGLRGLLRFGNSGQAMLKSLAEQKKLQVEEDKTKYEFEVKKIDRAINEITNLTNLPMAFASIDRQVAAKSITPQQGTELKTKISNAPDFLTWKNQTLTGMLDAKERLSAMAEQRYQDFRGQPVAAPAAAAPAAAAPMAVAPTTPMMPVPAERSVNAIQLGDGNVVYRVDGKEVPFAVYADAVRSRNQAQGANAAIAAAPAPMAPASAAPMAPAAPPDMANALALKIQGLQEERNRLRPFLNSKSAKADFDDLNKQIDNLSKGFSIPAGGAYTIPGVGMVERAAAAPAPSDVTRLINERNAAVARKAPPDEIAALNAAIKKATMPAQGTTVNVNAGQKAEKVKYGELLVDDFKNIKAQAAVAARSLPAIEGNLAILDKGFDTGFGTETIAAGARVLGALGVQNAKDFATDAQTFLASANGAVLQRQLEQKGPQTESDAQRITATGAQFGNTKDANKYVLNVAKAQLQRDLKQRDFYAAWYAKNDTFEGAEDAWYAGDGGKSLFESPILKKYGVSAVDQIPGQNRVAPTATGNSVTLPDGRVKTFPNAEAANKFKKAAGL